MPILWFEEGIDELGPDIINEVSQAVAATSTVQNLYSVHIIGCDHLHHDSWF